MEWASSGLRYGAGSVPNLNFTVPRKADVAYMVASGYNKNRLPIQWELLQPMLHDTVANAAAIAALGNPGVFHPGYESYITGVLDAHAAAGIKCIIDCHNYCRYRDFIYQADGTVIGLVAPSNPLLRPYTSDSSKVQVRIFALAAGATLKPSNFSDFWKRAALKWKDHPGFGGYGLMNEPHDLPPPGEIFSPYAGAAEDLMIWPAFAQAAINAIRALDLVNPIYLAGNGYGGATTISTLNPAWPLVGSNLIYEVHVYLDAQNSGTSFDYDTEVAKNYSAGFGIGPINLNTGFDRLKIATDWAAAKGVKLALTEIGMPIDDPRWEESFRRTANLARQTGCEIYSWMGGNHWASRNYAINHVPGWHQNKTLEPSVSGRIKAAAGVARATLFDDGPGWAPAGASVTITVYARGYLASPVNLRVSSSNGGSLSTSWLTIPAGANGQTSFSYQSAPNRVATLSYISDGQLGGQVPPPRKVFSLTDPVAYASTNLTDAAMAIIARYGACKWMLSDGYTDFMQGLPALEGQPVRAISDSGYGSSVGNAMEMLNWINTDSSAMGTMSVPVMRVTNGRKNSDHSTYDTFGFWCKKSVSVPGIQPNPRNRVPYNIQDAHFAIAAVSVPGLSNSGTLFEASKTEASYRSELSFSNSQPQASWFDANGQSVVLTSPVRVIANAPSLLALTCAAGAQSLRVNSAVVATANATFASGAYNQMLIGWGYHNYYPSGGFMGNVYAVITGQGAPTSSELMVLERYLGTTAGLA
jgi:endoglucanase